MNDGFEDRPLVRQLKKKLKKWFSLQVNGKLRPLSQIILDYEPGDSRSDP